jgi:invasion protein IalB
MPTRVWEKSAARFLAGALLMTVAGGAIAQQQQPLPPEPRQAPAQRTTATYEDWVVECETRGGPPPQKVCAMVQATQMQGKNLPFSRLVIGHPPKGQPVRLIVEVPVNVSFLTNVRIQTSDSDPGLAAPFARCLRSSCFASFEIKDDILKKLRAVSGAGKLTFVDFVGHDVIVPLSFKGFSQAFEALAKE